MTTSGLSSRGGQPGSSDRWGNITPAPLPAPKSPPVRRNRYGVKPVRKGVMPASSRPQPTPIRSKNYSRIPPVMRYAGWKVVVENDLGYGELVVEPGLGAPMTTATHDVILLSAQTYETLQLDPVTLTEVLKDIVEGSIAQTGGRRYLNDLPEFRRLMRE